MKMKKRQFGGMASEGIAKVRLAPTLRGAWRVTFDYFAFGKGESNNGPCGLGQFVAAQLFWAGVNTPAEAALVRFLADPPSLHEDAELPDEFEPLGVVCHAPTAADVLRGASVDAEEVASVASGDSPYASVDPEYEEEFVRIWEAKPKPDAPREHYSQWMKRAGACPVTIHPRGFEVPREDPLYKAFEMSPAPAKGAEVASAAKS